MYYPMLSWLKKNSGSIHLHGHIHAGEEYNLQNKEDGIKRYDVEVDDTAVHKAIREALANCLVNADFYVSRGVVIKKEYDSLILENPGYIRIGKDQMRKGGESDPRNKGLMKMFNLINIGERAGSGVPDIFHTWEQEGWIEPVIEERYGDASRTILILSFVKKQAKLQICSD